MGLYFENYAIKDDWSLTVGTVEGRPALLVSDPRDMLSRPTYFILLTWEGDQVAQIRDYRYAADVLRELAHQEREAE